MIYKIIHTQTPSYFVPNFQIYNSAISTGRSAPGKCFLNRDIVTFNNHVHKSKSHFDHCFTTSGPLLWNDIPDHVRCAPSLNSFRKQLKGHLFHLVFPT